MDAPPPKKRRGLYRKYLNDSLVSITKLSVVIQAASKNKNVNVI